jgi:hypothetical protein
MHWPQRKIHFAVSENYDCQELKMLTQQFSAVALMASTAVATIYYAGVAESGGEFGVYSML